MKYITTVEQHQLSPKGDDKYENCTSQFLKAQVKVFKLLLLKTVQTTKNISFTVISDDKILIGYLNPPQKKVALVLF